jgi:hypothetical protein
MSPIERDERGRARSSAPALCFYRVIQTSSDSASGHHALGLTPFRSGPHLLRVVYIIERAGRVFVALRKDGTQGMQGKRPIYHAVTPHSRMALCSDEPGNRSGWAEPPASQVTCPACLRRLARL